MSHNSDYICYIDFTVNKTIAIPISIPTFGFGVNINKSSVIFIVYNI